MTAGEANIRTRVAKDDFLTKIMEPVLNHIGKECDYGYYSTHYFLEQHKELIISRLKDLGYGVYELICDEVKITWS